jgi:hypothetical protein
MKIICQNIIGVFKQLNQDLLDIPVFAYVIW